MRLYSREGSPFWWYDMTVGGRRIKRSTKRLLNDREAASRVMAKDYDAAMNAKQFGEKADITLGKAFDRVIARAEADKTKTSYLLVKRKTLGLDVFANKGNFTLSEDMPIALLTDEHIEDLVESRREAGLTNNSINVELRVIKAALNACKKRYNVNHDLEINMLKSFEKTRFLTKDEEANIMFTLLEHKGSPSYDKARFLFIALIDTGMRVSEALGLQWSEVNDNRLTIEVYRQKTDSLTVVPMSDRLRDILRSLQDQEAPFEKMNRAVKVLRSVIDKHCNGSTRQNATRGKATIHSLRDTYASRLANDGLSLHKIGRLLGHSSVTMTRKYAHLDSDGVAEEARKMING